MSNLEIFIAIIFLGCISTSANVSGGKANEWKYGCYDSTAYKGDNTSIAPSEFGGDTATLENFRRKYGLLPGVEQEQVDVGFKDEATIDLLEKLGDI